MLKPYQNLVNLLAIVSYHIDSYLTPTNLDYLWSFGALIVMVFLCFILSIFLFRNRF